MFTSGQSPVSSVVFSLITFLIGIPSGIKIFNWVWTMYKGSVWLKTPMLYALTFLFLFTIGGVTGIMVGALAVDIHLHDTYFVVAHFHYVMMGGTVMAFLGGIHYWWPKMTGGCTTRRWARSRRCWSSRLQHDVLHPVRHGQPGHAAPVLRLPGHAVARAAPPGLDDRLVRAGRRPARRARQRPVVAVPEGQAGTGQPVGRRHARVDALHHAAGPPQLPPHAARDARPVRLRGPVQELRR